MSVAAVDTANSAITASSMTTVLSPRSLPTDLRLQSHSSTFSYVKSVSQSPSSLSPTGRKVETVMQPTTSASTEDFSSPSSSSSSHSTQQPLPTTADTQDGETRFPPAASPMEISASGPAVERAEGDASMRPPPEYSAGEAQNPPQTHDSQLHFCSISLQEQSWPPLEPPPPYFPPDSERIPEKSTTPDSSRVNAPLTSINNDSENDKCYKYSLCLFACALLFLLILPLIILSSADYLS